MQPQNDETEDEAQQNDAQEVVAVKLQEGMIYKLWNTSYDC